MAPTLVFFFFFFFFSNPTPSLNIMYAGTATLVNPPSRTTPFLLKPPKPSFFATPNFAFSGKFVSQKIENTSWGRKKTMGEFIETRVSNGGEFISSSKHAFEQEVLIDDSSGIRPTHSASRLNDIMMNSMSKWFVTAVFGAVILLRHDGKGLWFAMGSILNVILSTTLKKILNQERPASALSSGPGMPSSHAQSICFAVLITIMSMVEYLGLNPATIILSGLLVALGSYFSWLRVLLNYHTTSQVTVGAMVGSSFSISWFWAWNAFVMEAFQSFLWVRITLVLGSLGFCGGFLLHVYQHWMKGND